MTSGTRRGLRRYSWLRSAAACMACGVVLFSSGCGKDDSPTGPEAQPPGGTGSFLAWTGVDSLYQFTLVRVNGQTGSVTRIGGTDFFPALAYGPNGTLYGISGSLKIVNPVTGATALVGNFSHQGQPVLINAATFSPSGTLYVMDNASRRVFTVN